MIITKFKKLENILSHTQNSFVYNIHELKIFDIEELKLIMQELIDYKKLMFEIEDISTFTEIIRKVIYVIYFCNIDKWQKDVIIVALLDVLDLTQKQTKFELFEL